MDDCLVFANESGGILGSILVATLEHFDSIDLFSWLTDSSIPMLIVDEHQSRSDPQFIEYTNNQKKNGRSRIEWYHVEDIFVR